MCSCFMLPVNWQVLLLIYIYINQFIHLVICLSIWALLSLTQWFFSLFCFLRGRRCLSCGSSNIWIINKRHTRVSVSEVVQRACVAKFQTKPQHSVVVSKKQGCGANNSSSGQNLFSVKQHAPKLEAQFSSGVTSETCVIVSPTRSTQEPKTLYIMPVSSVMSHFRRPLDRRMQHPKMARNAGNMEARTTETLLLEYKEPWGLSILSLLSTSSAQGRMKALMKVRRHRVQNKKQWQCV